MATAVHLHSESGDHYLILDDGSMSSKEFAEKCNNDLGDEIEYCSVENIETTTIGFDVADFYLHCNLMDYN